MDRRPSPAALLLDETTGEIHPIAVVTDNGPCFKSVRSAAYIERRPELIHIRTRRNGSAMRRPLDVHLEPCTTREILKPNKPETLPLVVNRDSVSERLWLRLR